MAATKKTETTEQAQTPDIETRNPTAEALAGPGNELAHEDFVNTLAAALQTAGTVIEDALLAGRNEDMLDMDNQYLVQYITSKYLSMNCWATKKIVENAHKQLIGNANRLEGLLKYNQGSEMETVKIEQQIGRVHQKEHELNIADAIHEASTAVYTAQTGRHYGPLPEAAQTVTASSIEARMLVSKYAVEEPTDIKEARPLEHTVDGEDFILGADGQYHKKAS